MEPLEMYKEFLERLEQKTTEQLKAAIQRAREDSYDVVFDDPDVIRVVRCENCKYSRACYNDDGELLYDCMKDIWASRPPVKPDWFCGDGDEDIE